MYALLAENVIAWQDSYCTMPVVILFPAERALVVVMCVVRIRGLYTCEESALGDADEAIERHGDTLLDDEREAGVW